MRDIAAGFLVLLTPLLSSAATSANFLDFRNYLLNGTPQAVAIADISGGGIPHAVVATYAAWQYCWATATARSRRHRM